MFIRPAAVSALTCLAASGLSRVYEKQAGPVLAGRVARFFWREKDNFVIVNLAFYL